ncbi:hypothetical protein KE715_001801, partial [Salmonella enterica]|nr:hypothetical protein [Salmonella enterica]
MALPKHAKDFEPFIEEDYTHMKYCFRCQRKRKAILYADFVIVEKLVKFDPNVQTLKHLMIGGVKRLNKLKYYVSFLPAKNAEAGMFYAILTVYQM